MVEVGDDQPGALDAGQAPGFGRLLEQLGARTPRRLVAADRRDAVGGRFVAVGRFAADRAVGDTAVTLAVVAGHGAVEALGLAPGGRGVAFRAVLALGAVVLLAGIRGSAADRQQGQQASETPRSTTMHAAMVASGPVAGKPRRPGVTLRARRTPMRTIIALTLALAFGFTTTACDKKEDKKEDKKTDEKKDDKKAEGEEKKEGDGGW